MRLLLRSNSHRPLGSVGLELVSSPDTAGRESWQWHLRLDAGDAGDDLSPSAIHIATSCVELAREVGMTSTLVLSTAPARVTGHLETLDVAGPTSLQRDESQLVALVVGRGRVVVEHRHVLEALDVLVLEGDDPFDVDIEPVADEPCTLAVARLDPVDAARIVWVP